ncbi:hypothetical protein ACWGCW_34740 [Streptomyces sp. NPDC054933]
MRISRKTGILISSATVAALSLGAMGAAAAAVTADPPARPTAQAPVPDPNAVLSQLARLGAVSKVVESLQAAMADKQDPAKITQLVNQAKRQLDGMAASTPNTAAPGKTTRPGKTAKTTTPGKTTKPGKIARPNGTGSVTGKIANPAVPTSPSATLAPYTAADASDDLVAKAVSQLEALLNSVVKAVDINNPTKILDAVNAAALSTVNVVAAVLTASGLPASSLPGLAQTPALPSTATTPTVPAAPTVPTAPSTPTVSTAPNLPAAPSVPGRS